MSRAGLGEGVTWDWIRKRQATRGIRAVVEKALKLIASPEGSPIDPKADLNNLASAHAARKQEGLNGGTWAETRDQLAEVKEQARRLVQALNGLTEGAHSVLLSGLPQEAARPMQDADLLGLLRSYEPLTEAAISELHGGGSRAGGDTSPQSDDLVLPDSMRWVADTPPAWETRLEALALCCEMAEGIASKEARKRGRRRTIQSLSGALEDQLFQDCAGYLQRRGLNVDKVPHLARAVEFLVSGEPPSRYWGSEAMARFRARQLGDGRSDPGK